MPGATIKPVAGDVSTDAGTEAVLCAAPDVDVLVNNAGMFAPKAFEDITDRIGCPDGRVAARGRHDR